MTGNSMQEKLDDLQKRREEAFHAGSARSVERQHAKGKLLARERIEYLLDEGSFNELDLLARHRSTASGLEERPYTDGVITGWGTVDGRKVFVFSQDFTVFGGALGEVFAEKIHKLMDLALKVGAPVVGLNDGAGARNADRSTRSAIGRLAIRVNGETPSVESEGRYSRTGPSGATAEADGRDESRGHGCFEPLRTTVTMPRASTTC